MTETRRRGAGESERGADAADDSPRCMDAALRLLSYRPRTERELERRLREKGFSERAVRGICGRLKGLRYIDDRQFAAAWIKSRSGAKCRSPWLLESELKSKGIDPETARKALGAGYSWDKAFEEACRLVRGRLNRGAGRDDRKTRARMYNLLQRRGFESDFIRKVLAETMGREEDRD